MSLVFGLGGESDLIGALSVPRSRASRTSGGAATLRTRPVFSSRNFMERATAFRGSRKSIFADGFARLAETSGAEKEIRSEFGRIADVAGLTNDERLAPFGEARELSRVTLALATMGAALDLFGAPAAAVAWMRGEKRDEPFKDRSPLQMMGAEGRLGVEITLLYLRARLRLAPDGDKTANQVWARRRQG